MLLWCCGFPVMLASKFSPVAFISCSLVPCCWFRHANFLPPIMVGVNTTSGKVAVFNMRQPLQIAHRTNFQNHFTQPPSHPKKTPPPDLPKKKRLWRSTLIVPATQQDVEQTSAGPDVLLGPTLLQLRLQALVVSPPWRCRKVAKLVAGGGEDAGQSQVRDNDLTIGKNVGKIMKLRKLGLGCGEEFSEYFWWFHQWGSHTTKIKPSKTHWWSN